MDRHLMWRPLRFEPLYRDYVWGGRRLEKVLDKPLGDGPRFAESWEVVDHGDDQSVAASGPLPGWTLSQLLQSHPTELMGDDPRSSFPLLFKFLDANANLSLQVHPNDQQAAQLDPPDRGKTEAWVVVHAEPGAQIYAGLQPGCDAETLRQAVANGTMQQCMHSFEPRAGDCLFIRAGVPHALGAGLVVAEIQQSSDTTFRLFDWNRLGADGRPRPLHVEQALAVIDYAYGPVRPQVPQPTDQPWRKRLVACDKFVLDRLQAGESSVDVSLGGDRRFHILSLLDGAAEMQWGAGGDSPPSRETLAKGQTVLLPAAVQTKLKLLPEACLLDIYLPSSHGQ